uniref:THAP domaincontaining protein 9like [Hydra vulgaris] n=1 Tax=Lepeophtheirus salmonis TaxID=72036 RepID=A0A0K2VGA4_LEPSM
MYTYLVSVPFENGILMWIRIQVLLNLPLIFLNQRQIILVNLTLDEMSVLKKIQTNWKRFYAYVNIGLDEEELCETLPPTKALVF